MHRGADVYLVRRVRLTPIADLARSPKLSELASTIERLHIACSTELATLERISSRNRPNPWSGTAILGGAAATAVGLADAIATATTGVPWFGLTLGIVGMASAAAGARDKRRETEANANLVFEIKTRRRDLEELNEALQRVNHALAISRTGKPTAGPGGSLKHCRSGPGEEDLIR